MKFVAPGTFEFVHHHCWRSPILPSTTHLRPFPTPIVTARGSRVGPNSLLSSGPICLLFSGDLNRPSLWIRRLCLLPTIRSPLKPFSSNPSRLPVPRPVLLTVRAHPLAPPDPTRSSRHPDIQGAPSLTLRRRKPCRLRPSVN